jgi:hypothetical protein
VEQGTRPHPSPARRTLWALIPFQILWGAWLVTILTGAIPCAVPICAVATLDHHAAVLLACASSASALSQDWQ